jgi:hypothetical protein
MGESEKMKPILFSTPMVRAILEGSKTMTRRVVPERILEKQLVVDVPVRIHCEHYAPIRVGDVLWVRETWRFDEGEYFYKADDDCPEGYDWKPSIFMPKEAARIFLKVTGIRCERLQDITEEDAIKEGVETIISKFTGRQYYKDYRHIPGCEGGWWSAVDSFRTLWNSINGKRPGYGWENNPYVFVYGFERTEKE